MTERTKLRLRHIKVLGFKALVDFDLSLDTDSTLIIGPNGSGKSSILQVLDFMSYFAQGSPRDFFQDRHWLPEPVRSFANKPVGVIIQLALNHIDLPFKLLWTVSWGFRLGESIFEEITLYTDKPGEQFASKAILTYVRQNKSLIREGQEPIKGIHLEGSALSILPNSSALAESPAYFLQEIKDWARGILSLEALNPRDMRVGTRGAKTDIGRRGQHLASFVSSLNTDAKARLFDRMARFYPPFKELSTTRKRAGWVDMELREIYHSGHPIGSAHVSDGFLRLLALTSIPEFGEEVSIVTLDEVENGIDPHYIGQIVDEIQQKAGPQLMLTSHSPFLVNIFRPEDIVFIARGEDGGAISAAFDKLDDAKKDLEYQGPGEIWSHTPDELLTKWVRKASKKREESPAPIALEKPRIRARHIRTHPPTVKTTKRVTTGKKSK